MKNSKKWIIVIIIFLVSLYLFGLFIDYYSDWLWFKNLGYNSVFDTMILARISTFLLFFIISIIFFGLQLRLAINKGRLDRINYVPNNDDPRKFILSIYRGKAIVWFWTIIVLFFALIMGSLASNHWNDFLKFFNATTFNIKEPIFGMDAAFYIFKLPVYQFIVYWYLFMLVLTTIVVLFSYYLDSAIDVVGNNFRISKKTKSHLTQLAAFFGLGISALYTLKLFNILFATNGVSFGPSYTDVYAQIPSYKVLIIISLIISVLLFLYPLHKNREVIVYTSGAWVLVLIGFVWIYPNIIEQYVVKPNELKKETPYILNNIKFTRKAYGLSKIDVKPFPVNQNITYKDIKENHHTIENIRLWDRRPLMQTYKQLQEIRLYYDFKNVQIDRYHFDKYSEVALGARELPISEIPSQAQTWVNTHLIFTHGYGVVMSPVNEISPNGMPVLYVKDIPAVTSVPLKLKQMGIYYGEETDQYVLANTKVKEFDYPKGNENVYTSYKGSGGVLLSSWFKRLVFSWKLSDINILFTGNLTNKSRIMFYRNIKQRDQILAPFLSFDSQAYPVVGKDGLLYWIHDAYTTTNMFPYSKSVYKNTIERSLNYIRNSVKVVINAYNGSVSYYVIDPNDPIIQTYQKIYPKLFKPFGEMPDFLKSHIRYPTDLFKIQSEMYNVYHMKDAKVFYNQEDFWQTPFEIYSKEKQKMIPYYIIMRLPNSKKEEFILMIPFTPSGKDNMSAWMCARCDAPNYGKLIVYTLPKDKLIYGPMQIEARINQKPNISSELTLWGQEGSEIIKGNQLVIPIKNSFIYVEPIYLQSEKGKIPELKRVIVAYKENIEMKKTLDEAFKAVFNIPESENITPQQIISKQNAGGLPNSQIYIQANQALNHYNKALDYLKQNNWAAYGNELKLMKSILSQMAKSKSKVKNKN